MAGCGWTELGVLQRRCPLRGRMTTGAKPGGSGKQVCRGTVGTWAWRKGKGVDVTTDWFKEGVGDGPGLSKSIRVQVNHIVVLTRPWHPPWPSACFLSVQSSPRQRRRCPWVQQPERSSGLRCLHQRSRPSRLRLARLPHSKVPCASQRSLGLPPGRGLEKGHILAPRPSPGCSCAPRSPLLLLIKWLSLPPVQPAGQPRGGCLRSSSGLCPC